MEIDLNKLVSGISGEKNLELGINNKAFCYLYENLYMAYAKENLENLAQLDFTAFTLEELSELDDYYRTVIVEREQRNYAICSALVTAKAAIKNVTFI